MSPIVRHKKSTRDEELNPCFKEQKLSFNCMEANNYENDKCEAYFMNYKTCKDFWQKVQRDRKMKGIEPALPLIADRPAVKAEYMKTARVK